MTDSARSEEFVCALARLEESLAEPTTDFMRDSVIQRFEFTTDLAWKTLQETLEHDFGIRPNSPKTAIRLAYENNLITEAEVWLAMIDDRNLASHSYNQELANEIRARIPAYVPHLKTLAARYETT